MTDREKKDLRAYCAFLLKEYGFHFPPNDPVIPPLYIIHKEMQLNNQNNKALASQVKEASSRINPKEFHFHYPGEAWKFQLGVVVKWVLIGVIVILITWIGVWYWSMVKDVDKARTILEASGSVKELLKKAQIDKSGFYFIDFTAHQGDTIQFFREFQRVDPNTVRVYLGKE